MQVPKIVERFLVFFIGVPVVLSTVLLLPYQHHLAANCVAIILSALGGNEFAALLKRKTGFSLSTPEPMLLGATCPLAMTLNVSFGVDYRIVPIFIAIGAAWLLISRTFAPEDKLKDALGSISVGLTTLLYPGFFIAWLIGMASWPHADMVILIFLLIPISNDSAAWAAGILFGKNNRGIIKVSPNKSVAGFIGGLMFSMIMGMIAVFCIPAAFTAKTLPAPLAGLILGLTVGLAGCLGDLAESAMKRSAGAKDSGSLIPGRGGVLDSIDSICFAAPVYYVLYWLIFRG
ncbi:MAG: phosphatidate cytidylyltransferase [Treponema sp.]|jgi:phosphatidate cytidylyltransferase|nr:phosphatidate cytidylyltransferase [Treponema sp.]